MGGVTIPWTDQELQVAKQIIEEMLPTGVAYAEIYRRVASATGKSVSACQMYLKRKGFIPKRTEILHGNPEIRKQELEFIEEKVGSLPFRKLVESVNRWRKLHGLKPRTTASLRGLCSRNGFSVRTIDTAYISAKDVADGLRCKPWVVHGWASHRIYKKVLRPFKKTAEGKDSVSAIIYFKRENLAAFFKLHSIALEGMSPDFVWFMEVLHDKPTHDRLKSLPKLAEPDDGYEEIEEEDLAC